MPALEATEMRYALWSAARIAPLQLRAPFTFTYALEQSASAWRSPKRFPQVPGRWKFDLFTPRFLETHAH
jgi:hypothetical protein